MLSVFFGYGLKFGVFPVWIAPFIINKGLVKPGVTSCLMNYLEGQQANLLAALMAFIYCLNRPAFRLKSNVLINQRFPLTVFLYTASA